MTCYNIDDVINYLVFQLVYGLHGVVITCFALNIWAKYDMSHLMLPLLLVLL